MKALPPALLLGFLGLTMAGEAAAPTPALAVPPDLPGPAPGMAGSRLLADHRPALNAAPRLGGTGGSTATAGPR